jgi:LPXTG-site transpeptidase (sortase) family protein
MADPPSTNRRPGAGWLELLLRATGLICLGTAVAIVAEGHIFQLLGRWQLGAVDRAEAVVEPPRPVGLLPGDELAAIDNPPPAPGTPLGTIAIPEVGLDAVFLEGVGNDVLRRGVGHFPQTPMPGAGGNFALAGHRDTFFRGLRHVQPGQRVTVTTAAGREIVYRVTGTEIVEPTQVEVLDDLGRESLTLITCYPFRYVGPAPRRFVVRGFAEVGDDPMRSENHDGGAGNPTALPVE